VTKKSESSFLSIAPKLRKIPEFPDVYPLSFW